MRPFLNYLFYTVIFLLFQPDAYLLGQSYNLVIHNQQENAYPVESLIVPRLVPQDKEEIRKWTRESLEKLYSMGYLSASVDSASEQGSVWHTWWFLGPKYTWAEIDFSDLPAGAREHIALYRKALTGKAISPAYFSQLHSSLLDWALNNGYPFAAINWVSFEQTKNGTAKGKISIDPGPIQYIDTIEITGGLVIEPYVISRHIGIKQGDFYEEKKILQSVELLRQLPYLNVIRAPVVEFSTEKNLLRLYLEERPANQVNAILGLMPNQQETNRLTLTADVQLTLHNTFSRGEFFQLIFQQLQYRSPRIKLNGRYPFLMGSPWGINADFDLYFKDSSFRRTQFALGINYQLSPHSYFAVYYEQLASRMINVDTNTILQQQALPDYADMKRSGIGLSWNVNKTDDFYQPSKGWKHEIKFGTNSRSVRRNATIEQLKGADGDLGTRLYDSLRTGQTQWVIQANMQQIFRLGKFWRLAAQYKTAWMSGNQLFQNELWQIGGFNSLRGFDEERIFTNHYHFIGLEWRYQFNRDIWGYAFSDNAWVVSDFNEQKKQAWYNGFGLGLSLRNKNGVFNICYALGTTEGQPVQFRQSKIHFGYLAYF